MENRALGKGLSALIPEKQGEKGSEMVSLLNIKEIKANTLQPRSNFDKEKLDDLISSIREKGVLQPILVRKKDNQYILIAGERRLRAAQALDLEKVPAIIKDVSETEALILALIENIQREELNPIEEAEGFRRLISEFNLSQDDVAQAVGKNRSTVTNFLRLLKLPADIQKAIFDGALSVGHARALLSVENEALQKKLFAKTITKRLSVRELENLIKPELNRLGRRGKTIVSVQRDTHLMAVEEMLQKALGTKVRIKAQKKRGKIIIEYYSTDDLNRIIECIKK